MTTLFSKQWRRGKPQLIIHCYVTLNKALCLTFHFLSSSWRLFKPHSCWESSSLCIVGNVSETVSLTAAYWLWLLLNNTILVMGQKLRFPLCRSIFERRKPYPRHRCKKRQNFFIIFHIKLKLLFGAQKQVRYEQSTLCKWPLYISQFI